jgi:hypothetical protein
MRELSRHNHEGYNYTDSITTSVTIRVTPGPDDFLISWVILWAGFVILSMVATWQVIKENRIIASRRQAEDVEQAPGGDGEGEGVSTADITRSMVRCIQITYDTWYGKVGKAYNTLIVSHPGYLFCLRSFENFFFLPW